MPVCRTFAWQVYGKFLSCGLCSCLRQILEALRLPVCAGLGHCRCSRRMAASSQHPCWLCVPLHLALQLEAGAGSTTKLGMPCTTCLHPTCKHSPAQQGVLACPECRYDSHTGTHTHTWHDAAAPVLGWRACWPQANLLCRAACTGLMSCATCVLLLCCAVLWLWAVCHCSVVWACWCWTLCLRPGGAWIAAGAAS